jgi:hypothetical protein
MINRKIVILLIGAVVIAVCAEIASAEDTPLREDEIVTDTSIDEFIEPAIAPEEEEPVLIAPSPYESLEDDEAIPDMSMYDEENVDDEGNPVLIMGADTSENDSVNKAGISNIPAFVLFGAVIVLVLALVLKKKN